MTFRVGASITKREVWQGRTWLAHPVDVVADDTGSDVLAVRLDDGAPFTFPDHPGGRHPWAPAATWTGPTVLQLRRPDEWYSVWRFFDRAADGSWLPRHWYVNFERPLIRRDDGIETDDLELDLVIAADGTRRWKDVDQIHARLEEGRFDIDALRHVLAAAAEVTELLDRDERWWAGWDDWRPTR